MKRGKYLTHHPLLANVIIIIIVAAIGLIIAFISLNIFTRHGSTAIVPAVENMSYTQAIKILHEHGFRTDIRDSIYKEEFEPGYVVEQFPAAESMVKPGRKIFLYINAVHPREMIVDSDNSGEGTALSGYSRRQALAKLEELGFKKVNVITTPGESDRVIRLLANGKTVNKMERVPVNALITVEVYDGALSRINDSLDEEYLQYLNELEDDYSSESPESPDYPEGQADE